MYRMITIIDNPHSTSRDICTRDSLYNTSSLGCVVIMCASIGPFTAPPPLCAKTRLSVFTDTRVEIAQLPCTIHSNTKHFGFSFEVLMKLSSTCLSICVASFLVKAAGYARPACARAPSSNPPHDGAAAGSVPA